jgi:hypothetical protein
VFLNYFENYTAFSKHTHAASGLLGGEPMLTSVPPVNLAPGDDLPVDGSYHVTEHGELPGKSTNNVAKPGNLYVTTILEEDNDVYPVSNVGVISWNGILLEEKKLSAYPASVRSALVKKDHQLLRSTADLLHHH